MDNEEKENKSSGPKIEIGENLSCTLVILIVAVAYVLIMLLPGLLR